MKDLGEWLEIDERNKNIIFKTENAGTQITAIELHRWLQKYGDYYDQIKARKKLIETLKEL